MADAFKQGDKVEWSTSQGNTTGTVMKKLTRPTSIEGHHVAASREHPEYLVESDKSGSPAAHKDNAVTKVDSRKNGQAR